MFYKGRLHGDFFFLAATFFWAANKNEYISTKTYTHKHNLQNTVTENPPQKNKKLRRKKKAPREKSRHVGVINRTPIHRTPQTNLIDLDMLEN